uniref:Uncharacterized protein n=1 Tax=Setaria italica TaxID=4555 RepID=K3XNX4_SETIT
MSTGCVFSEEDMHVPVHARNRGGHVWNTMIGGESPRALMLVCGVYALALIWNLLRPYIRLSLYLYNCSCISRSFSRN